MNSKYKLPNHIKRRIVSRVKKARKAYDKLSQEAKIIPVMLDKSLANDPIYRNYASRVTEYMKKLPENVKALILQSRLKVLILPESKEQLGLFSSTTMCLELNPDKDSIMDQILLQGTDVINHELGHFLDYYTGRKTGITSLNEYEGIGFKIANSKAFTSLPEPFYKIAKRIIFSKRSDLSIEPFFIRSHKQDQLSILLENRSSEKSPLRYYMDDMDGYDTTGFSFRYRRTMGALFSTTTNGETSINLLKGVRLLKRQRAASERFAMAVDRLSSTDPNAIRNESKWERTSPIVKQVLALIV